MQRVKTYKVLLDNFTTNADKVIPVNIGDDFQFHDQRDVISLRSQSLMDEFFKTDNPTIDFEKYMFRPDTLIEGFDFYFYRQNKVTKAPVTYNLASPPIWSLTHPIFEMSSGFDDSDVPTSDMFLDSYFKFDFYLDQVSQKLLYSITLPTNGTMLTPGQTPAPLINFNQTIKTEIENIFWLRNPLQLPGSTMTGNTINLYCTVTFFNAKNSKNIKFKTRDQLPNSNIMVQTFTSQDNYIRYDLDYTTLRYTVKKGDGSMYSGNRIKLYAL